MTQQFGMLQVGFLTPFKDVFNKSIHSSMSSIHEWYSWPFTQLDVITEDFPTQDALPQSEGNDKGALPELGKTMNSVSFRTEFSGVETTNGEVLLLGEMRVI